MRICMVSPFAWSQPHPVNEHIAAAASELERRGHQAVVLVPSNRAGDLAAGRRALRALERDGTPLLGTVALGPAIPVSRRSALGIGVAARANLSLALTHDRFNIVHAHEPALPSLPYLALRRTESFAVATFHSPDRIAYPPGKPARERLLTRVDILTATSTEAAQAAGLRFPGEYTLLPEGVRVPEEIQWIGDRRRRFVLEWSAEEPARAQAALRALRALPDYELVFLRTRPLSGRPSIPRALRGRVHVRTALDERARAAELVGALGFVPAELGLRRLHLEAALLGVVTLDPPGAAEQPELLAAALARLAEDRAWQARASGQARLTGEQASAAALGDTLEQLYGQTVRRRRAARASADPLAGRPYVLCDLHLHTEHSYDCSVPVADLLDQAEAQELGAVAITDHNVFSGALEALELARDRTLTVIPGEEVMTDGSGEVIGLFLEREIPRGLTFAETVAAIREQGGLVYLPHPFDRMHVIPPASLLHRHLGEIDVLEVYNARLLRENFNDEALRFARKYDLTMGAGSDAHVLQGLGTGVVRMRAFEGPEEFLLSLRRGEILRRSKSLLYLQGLKWVAQARERRARTRVR